MVLGLCSNRFLRSRFLSVQKAGTAPCPCRAQPGTCERLESGYRRRCAKRLKDRKYASSLTPIPRRLQRSRDTPCMLESVYVEEGNFQK